jgi:hypothetical protein
MGETILSSLSYPDSISFPAESRYGNLLCGTTNSTGQSMKEWESPINRNFVTLGEKIPYIQRFITKLFL